jgi:hypothetical protein
VGFEHGALALSTGSNHLSHLSKLCQYPIRKVVAVTLVEAVVFPYRRRAVLSRNVAARK